jgi:hypothetical protein
MISFYELSAKAEKELRPTDCEVPSLRDFPPSAVACTAEGGSSHVLSYFLTLGPYKDDIVTGNELQMRVSTDHHVIGILIIIRGCIQKFPDWPPGGRSANSTDLCH